MRDLTIEEVDHEILSAIEATSTPDRMGEQSPIWEKVYQALSTLRKRAKGTELSGESPQIEPITTRHTAAVYFFGVGALHSGHSMQSKQGSYVREEALPAEFQRGRLDSKAFEPTPQTPRSFPPHQPLGVTRLQVVTPAQGGPAWTVISMWDRSLDTRYNCNAHFLTVGVLSAEELWALAERDFPRIVARIKNCKEGANR